MYDETPLGKVLRWVQAILACSILGAMASLVVTLFFMIAIPFFLWLTFQMEILIRITQNEDDVTGTILRIFVGIGIVFAAIFVAVYAISPDEDKDQRYR